MIQKYTKVNNYTIPKKRYTIVHLIDGWLIYNSPILHQGLHRTFYKTQLLAYSNPTLAIPFVSLSFLYLPINPQDARIIIGHEKTLQGNADPCMLYADEKTIEATARKMVNAFGKQRYIANLGHGLYPDLDKNKVKFLLIA